MCSNADDEVNSIEQKQDFKLYRKCLKCENTSVLVTRINDALCRECFLDYFNHKFRSTIGKSKIFEKDENVLFPYSADSSSVSMLNLISKGVNEETKKKITFNTILLFIEDSLVLQADYDINIRKDFIKKIQNSIQKLSGFKSYFALLENIYSDDILTVYNEDIEKLEFDSYSREKLVNLVNNVINPNSKEQLIKRLKIQLINKIAKNLKIKKIVYPITCTKLSIDLLTNVALGKGAHLSDETSLEEKNLNNLIYIRPLRELTSKEVAYYNNYLGLSDFVLSKNPSLLNLPNSTVYSLTEKFVNELQNNYPTTVSTIFRTSDKLTPNYDLSSLNNICIICQYPLDKKPGSYLKISAISDLEHSATISKLNLFKKPENFLMYNFCYSCSVVYDDLKDKESLPECIKNCLKKEIKNEIKEYLIED